MDYAKLGTKFGAVIKAYGAAVTINRLGQSLMRTYAVFDEAKTSDAKNSVSPTTEATAVAYIAGTFKTAPLPGDELIGKNRSYTVMQVEAYQPADVAIGFMLTLQ